MEKIITNRVATIILGVLVFFQIISGYSKGNYFFPDIGFKDLPLKELNKDSTLKIVKALKDYRRLFGPTDIFDTVNHFYGSDIDNDDTSEIIYYGITSAEGYWTIIWKADRQSYRLLGELYGKINGIGDSFSISTLAPAFKGSDCGYANLYRITAEWIDFLQSVAIFKGVTLPDSPPIREQITISGASRGLRAQPVINDTPDSAKCERYGVLRGNTIVELDTGARASATATCQDVTGKKWLFLVLEDPPHSGYNVYKRYKNEHRRICGWIHVHNSGPEKLH
jgi:hypothetical protein